MAMRYCANTPCGIQRPIYRYCQPRAALPRRSGMVWKMIVSNTGRAAKIFIPAAEAGITQNTKGRLWRPFLFFGTYLVPEQLFGLYGPQIASNRPFRYPATKTPRRATGDGCIWPPLAVRARRACGCTNFPTNNPKKNYKSPFLPIDITCNVCYTPYYQLKKQLKRKQK